jgi:hypothetical protein
MVPSQRAGLAKMNTLRIPIAHIALENHLPGIIESDGAIGAGGHARSTGDTSIIIDSDPVPMVIPNHGFFGADGHAGSFRTLLTTIRQKNIFCVPGNHTNSG